jgi:hypothetical protein
MNFQKENCSAFCSYLEKRKKKLLAEPVYAHLCRPITVQAARLGRAAKLAYRSSPPLYHPLAAREGVPPIPRARNA